MSYGFQKFWEPKHLEFWLLLVLMLMMLRKWCWLCLLGYCCSFGTGEEGGTNQSLSTDQVIGVLQWKFGSLA
jgi:hypothetical protein